MKKRFSQQRETKVEVVATKDQEKKRGEVFVVELNSAPVKEEEKRKPKGIAFTVDLDG